MIPKALAIFLIASTAYAEPGIPRPLPCGMSSSPTGEWKLVTVGGGGLIVGGGGIKLRPNAIFPVWIDSVGGPQGAVCTELHSVSRQNIYEVAMLRYLARPHVRAPREGACSQAVDSSSISAHFLYLLRPGDWGAVEYPAPSGEEGREVVYVPRPGEGSADSAIAACVKITGQMNSTPDQLSGTLGP